MKRSLPIILLLIGSECLELYRVEVPHYKRVGEAAELQCQFDLGRDRLYAVKWYKDNEEFFRYVPRFNPSIHTHALAGVHVDQSRSAAEVVVLKSVGVRSTGVYKCEVSAEAPSFSSFSGEGRMTVVYLPNVGPTISGNLRDEYEVGDVLDLNCTSSKSFPPARISWYINDLPVMGHADSPYYDSSIEVFSPHGKYPSINSATSIASNILSNHNLNRDGHNLIRSTSRRLQLELSPIHFGEKGTAKIRCVARIFPLFWQDGDEKLIDHKGTSSPSSFQGHATKGKHSSAHNSNRNSPIGNFMNEVDDGPPNSNTRNNHQLPSFDRVGSLYKGEALVQIRGGCGRPFTFTLLTETQLLLLILLRLLSH